MGQPTLGAARRWTSLPAALPGILAIALAVAACGEGDVTPPPPPPPPGAATVTVTPNDFGVLSLGTVQLTAEVLDNNGNPVSGATVTWSSNDGAVASVDANGLVTAMNAGSAAITAATTDGVSGTATAGVVTSAAFAADVQPIFTGNCAFDGCHGGSTPQQGMDLQFGVAFANIVNVPSMELPSMDRIEPNDPLMSYLIHKLRGTQLDVGGSGAQMPLGATPLDISVINIIRAWARDGAPTN